MPASTTLLQRLLTAGAALSLIAAIGVNASVARAITAPTITVIDINPEGNSSALDDDDYDNIAFNGGLLFKADDDTHGEELYKSDGTVAGTVMVKDVNTNASAGSYPEYLRRHGDLFYFFANDGVNGDELYLSDGTEAGTMRIPAPTATGYVNCDCYDNPIRSTAVGVFFTYEDPTVGNELGFVSDLLPETNTSSNGLALALLALSGALAAGAVLARRKELRAN